MTIDPSFQQFLMWLVGGALSCLVAIAGVFAGKILEQVKASRDEFLGEIRGVRTEMNELNQTLVKVVTNQDWQGKELDKLSVRVDRLELANGTVRDANES